MHACAFPLSGVPRAARAREAWRNEDRPMPSGANDRTRRKPRRDMQVDLSMTVPLWSAAVSAAFDLFLFFFGSKPYRWYSGARAKKNEEKRRRPPHSKVPPNVPHQWLYA